MSSQFLPKLSVAEGVPEVDFEPLPLCIYSYFSYTRDRIERSGLDGNYREVIVETTVHPFSITIFGYHIYWTDWTLRKLTNLFRLFS